MTDRRDQVIRTLREHEQRNSCCACGKWQAKWQVNWRDGHRPFAAQHAEHVADQLLALLPKLEQVGVRYSDGELLRLPIRSDERSPVPVFIEREGE